MENKDYPDAEAQPTSLLLSGLIRQQSELGSLGSSLVMLLLCAGVQPAFHDPIDSLFLPAPQTFQ